MTDNIKEAITRFAGPKCPDFDEGCFVCMSWKVLPSWLEHEHPKLVNAAIRTELQALASSPNWRVQLENRLEHLKVNKEKKP